MADQLSPQVQRLRTGDRHLLLNERDGAFYALNATAAIVLDRLTAGVDIEGIAEYLATIYRIDPAQARRDVDALLDEMHRHHLMQASR